MYKKKGANIDTARWTRLLIEAVIRPGLICEAFSAFYGYSLGNRLYALDQCHRRGIEPGPISTYRGWQEKGRQVRKGEKAIVLCMPMTRELEDESGEKRTVTAGFMDRPYWFALSQTDGEPIEYPTIPEWDRDRALAALEIQEVQFTDLDGNTLGYAYKREIAVSPLSPMPYVTTFHEIAHVVLGHSGEGEYRDNRHTPRNLKEVEAEAVALLCCESLDLPGAEYARGYIQSWIQGDIIPEKSAQKVFHAADGILKAGFTGES